MMVHTLRQSDRQYSSKFDDALKTMNEEEIGRSSIVVVATKKERFPQKFAKKLYV